MLSSSPFAIRTQWRRRRSSNSMVVALKASVAFTVNFILRLMPRFLQLCILRTVPGKLQGTLEENLDSLVTQGILANVTEPTGWVNSLVCVTKSNSALRLCLDLKDLNRAIKRPHYFTPTLEDILPKLSCARCFSILDSRSGYWNFKLDQESSQCTTFKSPFGRYRFTREIYPVSLELQTTLLCMDTMTAIMIRISVLSCNMPVRLAFVLTYNRRQNCCTQIG